MKTLKILMSLLIYLIGTTVYDILCINNQSYKTLNKTELTEILFTWSTRNYQNLKNTSLKQHKFIFITIKHKRGF